jgi:hypothetical protein
MPLGLSAVTRGQSREPLRENPTATLFRTAIKAVRTQADSDDSSLTRKVTQSAAIPAVYVARTDSANRACGIPDCGDDHYNHTVFLIDILDGQV